jgi:hypothetical protein
VGGQDGGLGAQTPGPVVPTPIGVLARRGQSLVDLGADHGAHLVRGQHPARDLPRAEPLHGTAIGPAPGVGACAASTAAAFSIAANAERSAETATVSRVLIASVRARRSSERTPGRYAIQPRPLVLARTCL